MEANRREDELLLIDYVLGRCDAGARQAVEERLASDPAFKSLHRNISNTFRAAALLPEREPPEDLVERTMDRIRRQKQTDALLAARKPSRAVFSPTFSLRELGAIAAVLVVMATIFVPSVIEARRVQLANQCRANIGEIGYAVQAYASENDGFLPGVFTDRSRWLPGGRQPAVSNSAGLFKLVGMYARPSSFQCPATDASGFAVRAGMTDFPSSDTISYSYQHSIGPEGLRMDTAMPRKVRDNLAILADRTPLFRDGFFLAERLGEPTSDNHGRSGQNVLYLGGGVDWKDHPDVGVDADNIFLAGDIRRYEGVERPTGPADSFLLPSFSPSSPDRR